jgi:hypothetical protein
MRVGTSLEKAGPMGAEKQGVGEYPSAPRCERAQAQVTDATNDRPTPALMEQMPDPPPDPTPP